jgi:DNA-binding GntR family transcriptional regulator
MVDGSLSNRVYDDILGRIISGRMKPGDGFNRRQVAAELGVSVAPVLEAMLELEAEGLIETLPRRGTRVRVPRHEDVWGQLVVREALEVQAARLYHGEPVRRHHARLSRLAATLDGLDPRSAAHAREEVRFHHYLVSLAQCPPLTEAFERVMKLGLLRAAVVLELPDGSAAGHVALVAALVTADADGAEAAVRAHVRAAGRGVDPTPNVDPGPGQPGPEETPFPTLPAWLGDSARE